MTHEYAGHYSAKHPAGTTCDPAVAAAVREGAEGGAGERRITCAGAHEIAADLGVAPLEVGTAVDLLEYRLLECQLGLFGSSVELKVPESVAELPQDLRDRLAGATSGGRVGCAVCWRIADDLGLERRAAAAACEVIGIKIKPCQLGAF